MKRLIYTAAFLALLFGGVRQAKAGMVLLNLEDPAGQTNTPYSFSFLATAGLTTVSFAGYQVPSSEEASLIQLTPTAGGSNLLGGSWTLTKAPSGSLASIFNDGTSVPALNFAGVVEDSFDTYTQTVATVLGQSYTLSFEFTNSSANAPSGFVVSTFAGAPTAVPEPASIILLGFGGLGLAGYRLRRRKTVVA